MFLMRDPGPDFPIPEIRKVDTKKKETFNEIINGDRPVLVDFFATWCGPCQYQTPILNEVGQEMGERARILKIDVDRNPAVAQQFNIQGVPTLILFKNGQVKWRQSGVVQASTLVQLMNQHAD